MPEVARGDGADTVSTGHPCDVTTVTDECSDKVTVGGIGIVLEGHKNKTHEHEVGGVCVPHNVALSSFSSKVSVGGKGVGRKGDSYGSEVITSGSSKLIIGG